MTSTEIILWSRLKSRRLKGFKFRRQYSIGSYIVDFYCPELKLAIEVDGDSHFKESAITYDEVRQRTIEPLGIRFLRFTNIDVRTNLYEVLQAIADELDRLKCDQDEQDS